MKVKVVYLVLIVAVLLLCYSRREHASSGGGAGHGAALSASTSSGPWARKRAPVGPQTWHALMYPNQVVCPVSRPYEETPL